MRGELGSLQLHSGRVPSQKAGRFPQASSPLAIRRKYHRRTSRSGGNFGLPSNSGYLCIRPARYKFHKGEALPYYISQIRYMISRTKVSTASLLAEHTCASRIVLRAVSITTSAIYAVARSPYSASCRPSGLALAVGLAQSMGGSIQSNTMHVEQFAITFGLAGC